MPTENATFSRAWPTTRLTLLEQVVHEHNDESWSCFVKTYGPLIRQYCRRRGLQEADAHDVAQEVLIQLSRGICRFRYDKQRGRFRGWLGTVTHRAMLRHLARSQRAAPHATPDASSTPPRNVETAEPWDAEWIEIFNGYVFREAMVRLLPQFDHLTWRAFHATFTEDRAPVDVAAELGRTVGWVYQAKSQVIRRLRDEILYLAEDSALMNLRKSQ